MELLNPELDKQTLVKNFISNWLALVFLSIGSTTGIAQDESADRGGSPDPASFTSYTRPDNQHRLSVGDKVSFRVLEEPDFAATLPVTSSGEIDFPLAGRIEAEGRTCAQVASELQRRLEKSFYKAATVVMALDSETTAPLGKVYLTGQVQRQGPIEIQRGETLTVAAAILHAGGFADFADRRRVRLVRPKSNGDIERFTVDVKAVIQEGKISKDMIVQPGDYIVVPERMFNF